MDNPVYQNAAVGSAPLTPAPDAEPALNPNMKPFHCSGCKQVVGYTDGHKLLIGGEWEFFLPVTFTHNKPDCLWHTTWRPVKPRL